MFLPQLSADIKVRLVLLACPSIGDTVEKATLHALHQAHANKIGYYCSDYLSTDCKADQKGQLQMPAEIYYKDQVLVIIIRNAPRKVLCANKNRKNLFMDQLKQTISKVTKDLIICNAIPSIKKPENVDETHAKDICYFHGVKEALDLSGCEYRDWNPAVIEHEDDVLDSYGKSAILSSKWLKGIRKEMGLTCVCTMTDEIYDESAKERLSKCLTKILKW